jgi:hypothetical protein
MNAPRSGGSPRAERLREALSPAAIDRVLTLTVNMRGLPASHAKHRDLRCARRRWAMLITESRAKGAAVIGGWHARQCW